jgi:hypothetical protein
VSKKGTALKKDLKHSPFVVEFEYGANNEGYWSYEHMVLQLEDCVDCLQVLAPQFDYLFLFDHSCGHDTHWLTMPCNNSSKRTHPQYSTNNHN